MNASPRRGRLLGTALLAIGAVCSLGAGGPVAAGMLPGLVPGAAIGDAFPESWFYIDHRTKKRYAQPATLEGKKMPELKVKDWHGEAADLKKLDGKIVVVDFWATWCPPCVKSLPKNAQLYKKYKDQDVLVIGVHDARSGHQKIDFHVKNAGITYPTGIDDGGVSAKAWRVSFWPTYAVVDHKGIVRAAGLDPRYVENVVKQLVAERDAEAGR